MRPFAETGVQWERAWRRARFRGWSAGSALRGAARDRPSGRQGRGDPPRERGEQGPSPRAPRRRSGIELGGSPARTRCDQPKLSKRCSSGSRRPLPAHCVAAPIGLDLAPAWVLDGPAPSSSAARGPCTRGVHAPAGAHDPHGELRLHHPLGSEQRGLAAHVVDGGVAPGAGRGPDRRAPRTTTTGLRRQETRQLSRLEPGSAEASLRPPVVGQVLARQVLRTTSARPPSGYRSSALTAGVARGPALLLRQGVSALAGLLEHRHHALGAARVDGRQEAAASRGGVEPLTTHSGARPPLCPSSATARNHSASRSAPP